MPTTGVGQAESAWVVWLNTEGRYSSKRSPISVLTRLVVDQLPVSLAADQNAVYGEVTIKVTHTHTHRRRDSTRFGEDGVYTAVKWH